MKSLYLLFILIIYVPISYAQNYAGIWYNVENVFDYEDDSVHLDEQFLPHGDYHWTKTKYWNKVNKIGKVLVNALEFQDPLFIGLCEVENRRCINDLIHSSPVSVFNFKVLHRESPDRRGIDVALLYNPKFVELIDSAFIKVTLPDTSRTTREIVYAKLKILRSDTIHVFCNHWPSKYGGVKRSEGNRLAAQNALTQFIKRTCKPKDAVLIMGDFNTSPNTLVMENMKKELRYLDLDYCVPIASVPGTHKFQGEWSAIDQVWSSSESYNTERTLPFISTSIKAYPFLLIIDDAFSGKKPFRTFTGRQYSGGFSDHLPLVLQFNYTP